jgi:RNA polymerase sigma-70 factor (ECF subfamily)
MTDSGRDITEQFEAQRPHLERVAHRMLGSRSDAEDAVQEAWLRLDRTGTAGVANLGGWLTTVVARVCLDMLRSRRLRNDAAPPVWEVVDVESNGPEDEALLADSVGLALLVVLDTLTPAERLAFVLHDMFAVPFDEIGTILERSPDAARQLASRARRRVRGAPAPVSANVARHRELVDAFVAASRAGDFDALVTVLHPGAVFRVRGAVAERTVEGAEEIARTILARGARFAHLARAAVVDGRPGVVVGEPDAPFSVVAFDVANGRIVAVDVFVRRTSA